MSIIKMVRRGTPDAANVGGLDLYPDDTSGEYTQIDENGDTLSLAVQRNKGLTWFRHAGTADIEVWYPVNLPVSADSLATVTVSGNAFYAFPFFTGRGGRLDRIAIDVTSGATAGGKARMGYYLTKSETNIYPGALGADWGEVATDSTGIKSITISEVMPADALVWMAVRFGSYATNPTVRRSAARGLASLVLGMNNTFTAEASSYIWKTETYAAYPDPAPSGLGHLIFNGPLMAVRYDA